MNKILEMVRERAKKQGKRVYECPYPKCPFKSQKIVAIAGHMRFKHQTMGEFLNDKGEVVAEEPKGIGRPKKWAIPPAWCGFVQWFEEGKRDRLLRISTSRNVPLCTHPKNKKEAKIYYECCQENCPKPDDIDEFVSAQARQSE